MADQAALQEAIQRARQLAAKITQNQPVKRPANSNDHSGPVKVTLAYEKPANSDDRSRQQHTEHSSRRRSSSRDHNRNVRDSSYSRESRADSRDSRDYRDSSRSRESRDVNRNHSSGTSSTANNNNNLSHDNNQYESPSQPPQSAQASRTSEEKIEIIIPHAVIGLVIGKGGENIKRIQNESGATVRVDPNTVDERGNKLCTITGTKAAVEEARLQVDNVIDSAATTKRPRMQPSSDSSADPYRMKIPASRTGAIIGKGGETIKSIKQQSGCDIELDKGAKECGPDESVFIIRGSQDKIMKARSLIEARLAVGGNRDREGRSGGGMREHRDDHHSSRSNSKGGVATGANAAPVGQYPDLPAAAYPSTGQQNSADMTAAWAAYFAQYSTLFNQTGAQPSTPGIPYPSQPSLLGSTASVAAPATTPAAVSTQSVPQMDPQQKQPTSDSRATGGQTQDYSDQWIEYYIANGRPDYAEQIIQMRKQQQQAHK